MTRFTSVFRFALVAIAVGLAAACQSPMSQSYSEIVIDTYFPTGPNLGGSFDVIGLFSESGVLSSQNPWTVPGAGALAVDGETGNGSNPNPGQSGMAYIDYKPATPLPSGTVLYVRISGYDSTPNDTTGAHALTGSYAIRVLTAPKNSYTYFGTVNASDAPYEPDTPPDYGAVPTKAPSITVNNVQGLNRSLAAADVDWVKITLP